MKDPDTAKARRVPSQEAKVWRPDANETALAGPTKDGDELCMGLRYVQMLGTDHVGSSIPSVPTMATTRGRSSFSSLESSHQGHALWGRVVVRMGEGFKFRVRIANYDFSPSKEVLYMLKMVDGGPLPRFLNHEFNLKDRWVEIFGVPGPRDLGVLDVGVYMDAECVARTTIDVVGRT